MRSWSLIVALGLVGACAAQAGEHSTFAALQARTPAEARAECWQFLKQYQAANAQRERFEAIWNDETRSLVDRVADSLAVGDAEVARLLASVRDVESGLPRELPALFRDARRPAFFRANIALAYAQALSRRTMYEEALAVLRLMRPTEVVDPPAYYFHRALAEHALLLRRDASRSIAALQGDVADLPERYRRVADLMDQEMRRWHDRDLDAAARIMQNVGRRISQARIDTTTYKMQSEIVARLDELIRQLERESPDDLPTPTPVPPPPPPPVQPLERSEIAKNGGDGNALERKLRKLAEPWGKLPDRERAAAMQGLVRDLPAQYREIIDAYFRAMAQSANGR